MDEELKMKISSRCVYFITVNYLLYGGVFMKDIIKKHNLIPNAVKDLFSDELFAEKNLSFLNVSNFPLFNVSEEDDKYSLEISLPGIDKENIKIKREDNVMKISYKKESHEEEKNKNYRRREFRSESFERVFTLPENIIIEEISSEYKNGLLKINLPKKVVVKDLNKEIEIEIK